MENLNVELVIATVDGKEKCKQIMVRQLHCIKLTNLIFILLQTSSCECNLQDYTSTKELDNECKESIKNGNETELGSMCSDRGECFCGSCYCNSNYAGKYCQCDKCPM